MFRENDYGESSAKWYICSLRSSIGAGDTFIAGILYFLLCHPSNPDVAEALRLAVNLASRKVQIEGFDVSSGVTETSAPL